MNKIAISYFPTVHSLRIFTLSVLKKKFRSKLAKVSYFHEYKGALSSPLPKWYRKLIARSVFHRAWVSGRFYWVRSNGALSVNSNNPC